MVLVGAAFDVVLGVAALGLLVLIHGDGQGALVAFGIGAAFFFVLVLVFGLVALRGVRRWGMLQPLPPEAVVRPPVRGALWSGWQLVVGALAVLAVVGDFPLLLGYGPGGSLAAFATVVGYRRIERTTGRLYVETHTWFEQRPLYYTRD
jgi:hypothetical protein